MNFGGMFDGGSGAIPFTGSPISQPVRLVSKPGFSSAGLSLGLVRLDIFPFVYRYILFGFLFETSLSFLLSPSFASKRTWKHKQI